MPPKKKVAALTKLQFGAGAATPAPPVGPALGQHGVNIMEFVKAYNAATESSQGDIVPAQISVYEDRSFTFVLKTPPAARLLIKAAGVQKGSGVPHKDKVGSVTRAQLREIAEKKMADLNANVEVAMRLGVDPRKADQMVRGTVNLPHGTGKTARVIVFAAGDKAAEAQAAGADAVGTDELVARIQGGWLDFDAAIATPDQMAKIGRIARILGPRGLMPNPKTGTVTMDVAKAVQDIKGGKITFRVDKHSNLHLIIGKASFSEDQLVDNYAAVLDEVLRAKPAAAKGKYLKKVTVTTTMGPGVPVDPNVVKNLR